MFLFDLLKRLKFFWFDYIGKEFKEIFIIFVGRYDILNYFGYYICGFFVIVENIKNLDFDFIF